LPVGRRQLVAVVLLALLVVASAVAAWLVPVPERPPAVALNSSWVFRGEVFLGFFIGAYVIGAILATTVASGRPPRRLGLGFLEYEPAEVEKAVEALSDGRNALEEGRTRLAPDAQREIDRALARFDRVMADLRELRAERPSS
jgi:hypothetical protein